MSSVFVLVLESGLGWQQLLENKSCRERPLCGALVS